MEVECLGACANAPMMQISHAGGDDYFEDLTAENVVPILDAYQADKPPRCTHHHEWCASPPSRVCLPSRRQCWCNCARLCHACGLLLTGALRVAARWGAGHAFFLRVVCVTKGFLCLCVCVFGTGGTARRCSRRARAATRTGKCARGRSPTARRRRSPAISRGSLTRQSPVALLRTWLPRPSCPPAA